MSGWSILFLAAAAEAAVVSGSPLALAKVHHGMPCNTLDAGRPDCIVIAVDKNGTTTINGKKVTCEQENAFFEKMAERSAVKMKPFPCNGYPLLPLKK